MSSLRFFYHIDFGNLKLYNKLHDENRFGEENQNGTILVSSNLLSRSSGGAASGIQVPGASGEVGVFFCSFHNLVISDLKIAS